MDIQDRHMLIRRIRTVVVVLNKGFPKRFGVHVTFRCQLQVDLLVLCIKSSTQSSNGLVKGEDRSIIDFGDKGTSKLVASGLVGGKELGSTGVRFDTRDESAIGKGVLGESKSKVGIGTTNFHGLGESVGEGIQTEVKLVNGGVTGVRGKGLAILESMKMDNIGRERIGWKIIHSFVKTGMFGNLDSRSFRVKPQNVLGCVGKETKKDAFDRVGFKLGFATMGRTNPNSATKGTELGEVILATSSNQDWGSSLITGREGIVNSKVMVKSIGPKLDREISSSEHCTNGIGNNQMTTFNRCILIGCISTGWERFITKALEKLDNFWIFVKLTTLIHEDILVGALRSMFFKKMTKPVDGGSLGNSTISMFHAAEMISNKDPGSFTIETNKVRFPRGIFGGNTSKGKIN